MNERAQQPLPDIPQKHQDEAHSHIAERLGRARAEGGYFGTWTLFRKEMHRYLSISMQTLISPVLTTMLWYLVFGYSLGDRLDTIRGIPYTDFLVPGLVMMGVITNSFLNAGFSFFIGKIHGTVVDLLITPLKPWQITAAYVGASVIRGVLVGMMIWIVAAIMGAGTLFSIGWTLTFMILTSMAFSQLGLITGILAKDFDHVNFVPNFLLLPLTFLGGVFYSIHMLPEPWDLISRFNPLVYMVNGLRYGMTGVSDVSVFVGFFIVAGTSLVSLLILLRIFHSGRGLRE